MEPSQLANACLNSFLLLDKDPENRSLKEELFKKLEVWLIQNRDNLSINRKQAQRIVIGLSATKLGSPEAWKIAEGMLLRALDKDIQDIKEKKLPLNKHITKADYLSIIHALTVRKVQNKDLWKLLMQPLLASLNANELNLRDLQSLTYDLYIIKL